MTVKKHYYIAGIVCLPIIYWIWKSTVSLCYAMLQVSTPDYSELKSQLEPLITGTPWYVWAYSLVMFWVIGLFALVIFSSTLPE